MTEAYSEKEKPTNRSRVDLPITSSDALSLSYKRLVEAKAIKLGSWDKHLAYCYHWNVNEINVMLFFELLNDKLVIFFPVVFYFIHTSFRVPLLSFNRSQFSRGMGAKCMYRSGEGHLPFLDVIHEFV